MFSKINFKGLFLTTLSLLTLAIIGMYFWAKNAGTEISSRLEKGWFAAPIEFYSNIEHLYTDKIITKSEVEKLLVLRGLRLSQNSRLQAKNFQWWPADKCQMNLADELPETAELCLAFRNQQTNTLEIVVFDSQNTILQTLAEEPLKVKNKITLAPYMFAQYYGERPILRQVLSLPDIPLYCSQAVTAIEDQNFLNHKGFSPIGFLRAAIKNLVSGYYAQGGSTITQQLVKNYFLTSEKTIKRKLKEIVMALTLETKFEKEQILENYLNVIYMGQNGPFEIRGFGSASKHYLNKNISQLNLQECALLAAILNNPGRYNPFRHPEKALKRREKVLNHMKQTQMIDQEQLDQANSSALPKKSKHIAISPAPYYVNAVYKKLKEMNFLPAYSELGLKVYTHLDIEAQKHAQKSVKQTIKRIEENSATPKKLKAAGEQLQGLLIHVNLETGGISSLVGGKSYGVSQYNRAIESHRQVGSVFKPLVYLSALETQSPTGENYTPLTMISDHPLTHEYEGQSWSPRNYSKKFHGEIPMYYALKNSINVATARLGIDIGLEHIMDVASRMGVTSELKPLPSLTLGAFEISPLELARVYSGIARLGSVPEIHLIRKIESLNGNLLYETKLNEAQQVASEYVSQLVGMMKQTFNSGTARSAKKYGFKHIAAGKTGTTSDTKDAWFAGFTPKDLSIVWVGYDNNKPSGLTGASGALPVWIDYMKYVTRPYPPADFDWPENMSVETITPEDTQSWLKEPNSDEKSPFTLITQ